MSPVEKIYRIIYRRYESHKTLALLYHLLTGKLYQPSHLKIFISDLTGKREPIQPNLTHCEAAVQWLFRAQDKTNTGGISAEYSFSWGWAWPLPEVTGYIIPTMFDCAKRLALPIAKECFLRAIKMADWLVEIQQPDGAYFFSLHPGNSGSVANRISAVSSAPGAFDTGQVIAGLARAYEETGSQGYLDAAIKAGDWLVDNQLPDGIWVSSLHNASHAFDTFLAWRLVSLFQLTKTKRYKKAAVRNLDWALSNQSENGWFNNCSHFPKVYPLSHGIAYAAQGLLEAGMLLNEGRYVNAARRTAEAMLKLYPDKGFLPARLDENWESKDRFTCLTGNAQVSILWSKLHLLTGDNRYSNAALRMNQDLKSLHNLTSANGGVRGGIKGSHPIWGEYASFRYPSWAAKFFIEALLLEEEIKGQIT